MIVNFQVIPTRHGDRIYTLDDKGILRVKQPLQTWREVPGNDYSSQTTEDRRSIDPLHSVEEITLPKPSILDKYTF